MCADKGPLMLHLELQIQLRQRYSHEVGRCRRPAARHRSPEYSYASVAALLCCASRRPALQGKEWATGKTAARHGRRCACTSCMHVIPACIHAIPCNDVLSILTHNGTGVEKETRILLCARDKLCSRILRILSSPATLQLSFRVCDITSEDRVGPSTLRSLLEKLPPLLRVAN